MRLPRDWCVTIECKPQDCWIGVFWKTEDWGGNAGWRDVWICIVPCLPIRLSGPIGEARAA